MINKVKFDGVPAEAILDLETPDYENIMKTTVLNSDAVIIASDGLSSSLTKFIESSGKPFLPLVSKDNFGVAYTEFYKNMLL
jgi:starch synthase